MPGAAGRGVTVADTHSHADTHFYAHTHSHPFAYRYSFGQRDFGERVGDVSITCTF